MNFDDSSLGELVAENYRRGAVLSSYGLDFCCRGDRTLRQACTEKGIDLEEVNRSLQSLSDGGREQPLVNRFSEWPLGFLVDYVLTNHHQYLHKMLPITKAGLEKIARVHGPNHPELAECSRLFNTIVEDLHQHLWKEENVLFPYIKALDGEGKLPWPKVPFDSVATPIHAMRTEHEREGGHLFRLRELTANYKVPDDGCNTYQATFGQLAELDADLIQHIHIENNILFPRAIEREKLARTSGVS
jgi:regulator of cell morphogenesis and NO signaling